MNTDILDVADYSDIFQNKYKIIFCDSIENLFDKLVIYDRKITDPLVIF